MLSTTLDAVKALLKADPTLTPADRARILASIRNHGKAPETLRPAAVAEKQIWLRAEVARRFSRSLRFVDHLAKDGILRRGTLPGRIRACGFLAEEVERLMSARFWAMPGQAARPIKDRSAELSRLPPQGGVSVLAPFDVAEGREQTSRQEPA